MSSILVAGDTSVRQGAFSPEMAATLQAVKTAHPKGTL